MEEFTFEQKLKIRCYFDYPNYPQSHGEAIATQLLSAMIASGKYELEEYPRLVEAAIRLTGVFVIRLDAQLCDVNSASGDDNNPKPPASENGQNSDPDSEAYDPIPF